ncbi:Uncharacterised protein [Mycobacteroides abscessus subsp. abscessus]|jgi:hypothetical protein|uniref:hypothetical protein n=1 Tax=Mycobacteroides abscessus TaxID=36809 RepID=UPI0009280384|nr:hypothetical protein [Mycobacteroides abscessus]SIH38788.1 Uncharacterised protein [Mycobacteroides abscessus subsp. abscessus]
MGRETGSDLDSQIDLWISANNVSLKEHNRARFQRHWKLLHAAYRTPAQASQRDAALLATVRFLEKRTSLALTGKKYNAAREQLVDITAATKQIAVLAFEDGETDSAIARELGVDRSRTVPRWLGKQT